jgi:hypothetical protein
MVALAIRCSTTARWLACLSPILEIIGKGGSEDRSFMIKVSAMTPELRKSIKATAETIREANGIDSIFILFIDKIKVKYHARFENNFMGIHEIQLAIPIWSYEKYFDVRHVHNYSSDNIYAD